MKTLIISIGKTEPAYLNEGFAVYEKRLKHYLNLEVKWLTDKKIADRTLQVNAQNELILNEIEDADWLVLLDENGKSYTSVSFATQIQQWMNMGKKRLVFVIGGAYGFNDSLRKRANATLSLSGMTFSHQMVRLFMIEQLYRAMTILKGENYHHE
ncbi:MAG: 23S rRNA (pseudouridine(1915)-N(3))-methyltransferase RlmH [Cytophagales bacterium]